MKRLPWFLFFLLKLSFVSTSFGQSENKINKSNTQIPSIVGTWRLIEFTDFDAANGKWIFPFGRTPGGFFTYTKSGIMNLNICSDNPLKISADSAKKFNINLFDFINTNSLGYFGTYTVDLEKSIVTHHVKGGSLPWYIDTDQKRPFTIKGDTLIIDNNKTWKRVLVRAD